MLVKGIPDITVLDYLSHIVNILLGDNGWGPTAARVASIRSVVREDMLFGFAQ